MKRKLKLKSKKIHLKKMRSFPTPKNLYEEIFEEMKQEKEEILSRPR